MQITSFIVEVGEDVESGKIIEGGLDYNCDRVNQIYYFEDENI